ncbi:uncharacterized protein BO95DRAFT_81745 [Aspergillus brunneoviolaceus CBS 621.78]|uniref:Uncharacterized protein n=1 Tax=Aspergillus brunneoviolaceus CBS 621.78 TaxID=1450534 RepID=A0ACD1GEE2_9EURO|nr:hypothetical protein BO95DRAFT_81745 [Aspergillus brunneoviolaceus CBS 621.78]RAH47623.1 hypothetical protein BO95DRAFT_81745 [Aspergillus brunneoviolaceus CBS 621.78]
MTLLLVARRPSSNPHTEALTDPHHSIHTANYAIPGIPLPFPKYIRTIAPALPIPTTRHYSQNQHHWPLPSLQSPRYQLDHPRAPWGSLSPFPNFLPHTHTPYPYTKTKKKTQTQLRYVLPTSAFTPLPRICRHHARGMQISDTPPAPVSPAPAPARKHKSTRPCHVYQIGSASLVPCVAGVCVFMLVSLYIQLPCFVICMLGYSGGGGWGGSRP